LLGQGAVHCEDHKLFTGRARKLFIARARKLFIVKTTNSSREGPENCSLLVQNGSLLRPENVLCLCQKLFNAWARNCSFIKPDAIPCKEKKLLVVFMTRKLFTV
jgi:hypothetical protein